RRRHTSFSRDWSSDVCSSDLAAVLNGSRGLAAGPRPGRVHCPLDPTRVQMAKPNYSFEKRQRELAKKKKQDEKDAKKRAAREARSEERRVGKECRCRRSPQSR